MKSIYKKFKDLPIQMISYRFGKSLEEPYSKFNTYYNKDKDTFICLYAQVDNYDNNKKYNQILFETPSKKFKLKQHLEVVNGSRSKS